MKLQFAVGVVLISAALFVPAQAKKPVAADEAAVRSIIERVYAAYTKPLHEAPEDGSYAVENNPGATIDGYEPPYTATLDKLVARWSGLMKASGELYNMNGFDWYCQCQDFDSKTAKMIKQSYKFAGKDRIDANILFSPGWAEQGETGSPLVFRFKREDETWKLDDLTFDGGDTLRKDLATDIKNAMRDQAKASR
jgi:hypothetical protein